MKKDWEIIEDACDIAEERGICARTLVNDAGEVCFDGALAIAVGLSPLNFTNHNIIYKSTILNRICNRFADALELSRYDDHGYLISGTVRVFLWNDDAFRNATNVSAPSKVLTEARKVAKIIRMEEEDVRLDS